MKSSCQQGRTLIEMIGVLGIIGILSIGALTGYTAANSAVRINKMGQDVVSASSNIRKLYSWQHDYKEITAGQSGLIDKLCKENIFLDPCVKEGDKMTVSHALGGKIQVTATKDGKAFIMSYKAILGSDCFKLLSQDLRFIHVEVKENTSAPTNDISKITLKKSPLDPADAVKLCKYTGYKALNFYFR